MANVLIVDDHPDTCRAMAMLMRRMGHHAVCRNSGRDALDYVDAEPPHLILLDLMMPEMDGFEFVAHVKADPALRTVPIVVVTAKDITDAERKQLNGQVSRVLQKGAYSRDDLLAEVSRTVTKQLRGESTPQTERDVMA